MSMISVLPEFMCRQTEEQIFAMVIGHTTTWFSNENLGGEQPRDAKGNCLYYQDTNPYWVDMREAMDRFTLSYDYTHLSTFYADLVEYIVMTVRLYFFIRGKQFPEGDAFLFRYVQPVFQNKNITHQAGCPVAGILE